MKLVFAAPASFFAAAWSAQESAASAEPDADSTTAATTDETTADNDNVDMIVPSKDAGGVAGRTQ
ncbi:MAG: hypothetical protein AB7H94_29635 [Lautropia sp.]